MKTKLNIKIGLFTLLLLTTQSASAYSIQANAIEDSRCDPLPQIQLSHELGDTPFPVDELLVSVSTFTPLVACVGNDGIANDWLVTITNLSPNAWKDLIFVADQGNIIGNSDGVVFDASGLANDAFLIDYAGINSNLISESMTPDVIFEPGETWEFLVTNFMDPNGLSPIPTPFDSLDIGSLSSPGFLSTASIIANPVPVPAAVWLFGSGLFGLLAVARKSNKS